MRYALMAWWLLTGVVAAQSPEIKSPNVLLITVDDMSQDSVGIYGCQVPDITPNIDRLAGEGIRFVHSHVTVAVCQPTRAVWLTGRYPHHSGALGFQPIRPGVPTLAEALQKAGYLTGAMAKIPHLLPSRPKAWDVKVEASQLGNGRSPELYYQQSKAFFEQARQAGKPFFLMANSQDPHRPFAGSQQEQQARRLNNEAGASKVSRTIREEEVDFPGFLPDLPDVRKEIAQYFTSVHRADEITGAVLKALDETGNRENTLVIFLSDHGMPLPFAKTNCYLHSTRTPWLVRWPGKIQPGTVDEQHLISGIDLTPTILDLLKLPPLEGIDGRSIKPLLLGGEQTGRDVVFTHFHKTSGQQEYPMRAVVTKKYGYIYNAWSDGTRIFRNESQAGLTMKAMNAAAKTDPQIAARVKLFLYRVPEELYDYETDPDALHNLIDDPQYAEQVARFRRQLQEHLEATDDPLKANYQQFLEGRR